jgi:hypothetical protein
LGRLKLSQATEVLDTVVKQKAYFMTMDALIAVWGGQKGNVNGQGVHSYFPIDKGTRINPLDWFIATAKELGLTRKDMFQPAPRRRKPIQIPKLKT